MSPSVPASLRLGALAALLAAPATADVLVVDPGGMGDHLTIAAAYAVAAPGDVLLVRGGSYPGLVIDKAVSIVADTGTRITWTGQVELRLIPLDQQVVFADMLLLDSLKVRDCDGALRFQDCEIVGADEGFRWAVQVDGSSSLVFAHCALRGGQGVTADDGEGLPGGPGIAIWDGSRVALYECTATGGHGGDGGPGGLFVNAEGGPGEAGVTVTGASELYAMGCTFEGGDGGAGYVGGGGGEGGDGVHLSDGASIARLTTVQCTGGAGGVDGNGTTYADDGQPTVGAVEFLGVPRRELQAPTVVRENELVAWTVVGRPGDLLYLPASLLPKWRFLYAASGVQSFDFPLVNPLVPVGVIGPDGTLQLQLPVPPIAPGQESRTLFHQVFVLDLRGLRVLGGAHAEVALDETL